MRYVGLSIVLESQKCSVGKKINNPQVINKTTMIINNKSSSSSVSSSSSSSCSNFPVYHQYRSFSSSPSVESSPTFLDQCFLCKEKLLPGKDIYMYKGDTGFCSVECRCRQIFMDEEESIQKDNCSLTAIKPISSSSSSSSRHRRGTRNRAGGFAC